MLVLSRKKNDNLVINNNITITVVEIRGDKVRLGIVAPPDCPVQRQEVFDAIHGRIPPDSPPVKPSPDEASFLQAILDQPDDTMLRLIYADWLEERGNPRSDFIRVQCQLAELPPGDPQRKTLEQREAALWRRHGAEWRASLSPLLRYERFVRGFVESMTLTVQEFLQHGANIFASVPVRHFRVCLLSDHRREIAALIASPYLARLTSLDLSYDELQAADAAMLVSSPHLTGLTTLNVKGNRLGDEGATALAQSPHLTSLTVLDCSDNQIGADGARALAASPYLANLTRLDVTRNPLGVMGLMILQHRFGDHVCG